MLEKIRSVGQLHNVSAEMPGSDPVNKANKLRIINQEREMFMFQDTDKFHMIPCMPLWMVLL